MKRFMKKALAGTLSLAMVFGMAAVVSPETASAKKVTVKKVTVSAPSGKTAYVAKGKKVKLSTTVKVTPNKSANKKVTYKSANKKIVTVNSKGYIKGVKAGKTKITVVSKKNKKKKATIKVVVKKAAIKSVKLTAKSATVAVGESKALKAKVSPKKNTCTKVVWSSANKKVATVTSGGVVKGIKAGKTTITAKAADGSGKKASCKVTVSNAVNLSNMDVLNAQSVSFSLDKPQALTPAQVSVKTKLYVDGTYNRQLKIDNMTTADNKNYTVVVTNDDRISMNSYVQVSIPSLTGNVRSLEKKYSQDICAFTNEEISSWTVNEYDTDWFSFSGNGYSTYQLTGLPAGLTAETKSDYIYVKGTPTTAGMTQATMTAKDELGNTLTKTIYFIIGSETQIAGAGCPVYTLASDRSYVYANARFVGGSGSYSYSIIGDTGAGATIDESSTSSAQIKAMIAAPGDYNVTVRATDKNNPALFSDAVITIHVAQGVTIAGMIKDASGNAIPYADMTFEKKNRADRFGSVYSYFSTDENGTYSALVSAGTYDIAASYHNDDDDNYSDNAKAVNYLYKQDLGVSRSGFDINLPLYKVTLVSADQSNVSGSWYANHEYMGYGNILYVKAGNYSLETREMSSDEQYSTVGDWFNGRTTTYTSNKYKYTATANVASAAVQAVVNKTVLGTVANETYTYPAAKDTTYTAYADDDTYYWLDETGDYYAYKFVPETTGKYYISNSWVYVYDAAGNKLASDGDGYYSLNAATTYIIGEGGYDSEERFRISGPVVEPTE